jgi:dipeptidyl aminopeptidase/acylaminoacyl peptidase
LPLPRGRFASQALAGLASVRGLAVREGDAPARKRHRPGVVTTLRRARLAVVASFGLASSGAAEAPEPPSVRALFENPTFASPVLSDDGETVALIHSKGDLQFIVTRPLEGENPKMTAVARLEDPDVRLNWIEWASSTRLLMSANKRNPNGIGMRSRVTRLFGVDANGENFDWLGKRWPYLGQAAIQPFYQDQIVHWTPEDPGSLLIQVDSPYRGEWPRVSRMNVHSGALRPVQGPKVGVREWQADKDGNVRAGVAYQNDKFYELWTRIHPKDDLALTIRHEAISDEEEFVGFHADDPAKIYVTRGLDGRKAVYEFDLREKKLGALVFAHPEVDVDGLLRSPAGDWRVIGVAFTTDSPQVHYLDPQAEREARSLHAALSKQFGGAVQIQPQSRTLDGNRLILRVSSDTQPPTYFVYNRSMKRLFPLIDQRPAIKREQLSETKRVTYQARDGLTVPAYLTLPSGRGARNLPLIALVHGGPWARDWIRWDPEVQLFASRGFAVLQMNFRGSSGLGKKHLEAGYREWGQKIQDDITDGVKWAIAQGIADPDRVGITGGSYGGYATLVGLTKTPELYRAGAAYASVTDIEFLISDDKWYEWGYEWHETMVGGEPGDRDRLRAASPLRNAANVHVPVLLGHGVDDQRVHVHQSQRMAKALRDAGKDVEYLEFPSEIHGFLLESNRIRWYEALIAFFEKNLAPRARAASATPPPAS